MNIILTRLNKLHRSVGWLVCILVGIAFFILRTPSSLQTPAPSLLPIWSVRPVLPYFALTDSLEAPLRQGSNLTEAQWQALHEIAGWQVEQFQEVEESSLPIVQDPMLSLEEKRQRIASLHYNERIASILSIGQKQLAETLGATANTRLANWMANQWEIERATHGMAPAQSGERSYKVFATRYNSKGRYTAALPDQCLKFANGGSHYCDKYGYIAGGDYSIYISYKKGVAFRVLESGPWNIDDNYWASVSDPTPRRMFADLAVGMPEAQAAYFNGYNGGQDQYGRKVTAPFAIDLSFEVSDDIGLGDSKNDWVVVSYMWTADWGKPSAANSKSGQPTAGKTTPKKGNATLQVATPNPDGSVIHVVQSGEALWSIAIAYGVKIKDILSLNGLSGTPVIFPGQKLFIHPAGDTPTPSSTYLATAAFNFSTHAEVTPAPTLRMPASQPAPTIEPTPVVTLTPKKTIPSDPLVLLIAILAILGSGLTLFGILTGQRRHQ